MPKAIVNLVTSSPGTLGLNTQEENTQLSDAWATKAENCVFDDTGRLSCRKGWQYNNATAITNTPNVTQIHEYVDGGGSVLTVLTGDNKVFKEASGTITDISGTITTPTADNWKFVNFNGKCIGFQSGHAPIVASTVAGNFADIVLSGTQQPTTSVNEVLAAFGRLWVLDGTDLKYSDSLDETAWNGVFDLSTVWLSGMDEGVALAEFNGHLVVFGKESIIIYNNPWSPSSGGSLDTTAMTLVENISGIGCIARDSVQHVGKDLVFLSSKGLRSLGRTIQEKSMPLTDYSVSVNDALVLAVSQNSADVIRSVYSEKEGFYLLILPTTSTVYYFDLRAPTRQGNYRIATWDTTFYSACSLQDGTVKLGLSGGYIADYQGYLDGVASDGSGGSTYTMTYHGTWTSMNDEVADLLKMAKKITCTVFGGRGQTLVIKWAFDYLNSFKSKIKTISGSVDVSEWGIMEWGLDEWGGGSTFHTLKSALSNSGRVIKTGISITINGNQVSLQQIVLQAKIGRIAQ